MSFFKHTYQVNGDLTQVFLSDFSDYFTIDTEDLLKVIRNRWKKNKAGYIINGTKGLLHRWIMDCPKDKVVDHISHNTLNNSKNNLRICDHSENNFNRLASNPNSKTAIRGITFNKKNAKYKAQFTFRGEHHFLGYFDKLEDAQDAVIEGRYKISNFSEIDNPIPNVELLKQKEARELYLKSDRIKIPKFSLQCCGAYSPTDYKTSKHFKCYLHYPTVANQKGEAIKFCLTYRLVCPYCDKLTLITFNYNKNNEVINARKITKQLSAIDYLTIINTLFIKELDVADQVISTPAFGAKKDNWFYGVAVEDGLFARVSLTNGIKDGYVITTKSFTNYGDNYDASLLMSEHKASKYRHRKPIPFSELGNTSNPNTVQGDFTPKKETVTNPINTIKASFTPDLQVVS